MEQILLNIFVFCFVLSNIYGQINDELVECNAIYINSNELERMNLKEQEEYVKKNISENFDDCFFS